MNKTSIKPAILLGLASGMRTFSAPALLSRHLQQSPSAYLTASPIAFFQSPPMATILKILAIGELAGDKIPGVPDRIAPLGLTARCIAGATAGAIIAKTKGGQAVTGALAGGIAAVTSAFLSYYLRKEISAKTKVPDAALGLLEDALVLNTASRAL